LVYEKILPCEYLICLLFIWFTQVLLLWMEFCEFLVKDLEHDAILQTILKCLEYLEYLFEQRLKNYKLFGQLFRIVIMISISTT